MSTQPERRGDSQTPEELLAETQAVLGGPPPPGEAPPRQSAEVEGTEPTLEQPVRDQQGDQTQTRPTGDRAQGERTRGGMSAGMWLSLILGAVVLVLLLIFILQNNVPADFQYFGWQFELPLGIAMLFAAIGGIFIAGIVGSVRIFILGRRLKKVSKALGPDRR